MSNRGASVRIPWQVEIDKKGYIEDRRPNANMDPYVVTRLIVDTCCSALGGRASSRHERLTGDPAAGRSVTAQRPAVRARGRSEEGGHVATPSDVLKMLQDESVEIVDIRFCDLPGLMQHFSIPAHELTEDVFDEGLGFDGSSIRGFQEIQESDMLLIPDPDTAVIDPFRTHKTLNINCFVQDPVTGEPYSRDPRYIAKKAEDYLRGTGIADTAYFGPEAEFYIFDSARFDQNQYSGYYFLDSIEGVWNSGRERELDGSPNLGYKIRYKEGYFPVPPMDQYQDLRSEMMLTLEQVGHPDRGAAPRGRHRGPGRDRHALRHAVDDGRQADALQVRRSRTSRTRAGKTRHLHAEAAVPGQRLGHARAPVALEGRRAAVLRREGLRGAVRPRALVHRRPAQARAVAARDHEPDDELVQAAGAGLRGAGQPRVLAAQPVGRGAHPALLEEPEGEAASSSAAPTRRATRTSRSRRC